MPLKIGDFAKLANISVRMLRHYGKLDLLKPATINTETGFRYYDEDQLVVLHRIRAFQAAGFSLKEIHDLLQINDDETMHRYLWQRKQTILSEIQAQERRLIALQHRIDTIEKGQSGIARHFLVEHLPAENVLQQESALNEDGDILNNFRAFVDFMQAHRMPVTKAMGIKHYTYDKPGIFEWAFQVSDMNFQRLQVTPEIELRMRQLESTKVARAVIHGSYSQSLPCQTGFEQWAAANRYELAGATREIYIRVVDGDIFHPDNLMEIQFPIRPI